MSRVQIWDVFQPVIWKTYLITTCSNLATWTKRWIGQILNSLTGEFEWNSVRNRARVKARKITFSAWCRGVFVRYFAQKCPNKLFTNLRFPSIGKVWQFPKFWNGCLKLSYRLGLFMAFSLIDHSSRPMKILSFIAKSKIKATKTGS